MQYPSIKQFVESNFEVQSQNVDQSLGMITACIEQVYSEDESWTATDFTEDELKDFVELQNYFQQIA